MREDAAADIENWQRIATAFMDALLERAALGDAALSESDRDKLGRWTETRRRLLSSFDFESARPEEVTIDEAMRPTVEGYDISFQSSASDGIRLRWAYLLSLLEAAMSVGERHPGLVIFDEPGQQGVEASSLAALCRKATEATTYGQIVFTTSESRDVLGSWFDGESFQLIDLGSQRLLQPIT